MKWPRIVAGVKGNHSNLRPQAAMEAATAVSRSTRGILTTKTLFPRLQQGPTVNKGIGRQPGVLPYTGP